MNSTRLEHWGPRETADPKLIELWDKILKEVKDQYPLTHPMLLAEAERAHIAPEKTQLIIAHEQWLDERRKIDEKWRKEYVEEAKKHGEEEAEYEEEDEED